MIVEFYKINTIQDEELEFAVICAEHKYKFVYVRHKDRMTWEIPGGHREKGETIDEAGKRELFEETGATDFAICPLCDYSVTKNGKTSFGRLFYSSIERLGELPDLEIEEVKLFDDIPNSLTYPEIQPLLYRKAIDLKKMGKWL